MRNFVIVHNLLDNGGVPGELRSWINSLCKSAKVIVITEKYKIRTENVKKIDSSIIIKKCTKYSMFSILSNSVDNDSVIVNFGYFNYQTLLSSVLARTKGVKYVLVPFAQITNIVFKNKIFSTNPDISQLSKTDFKQKLVLNSLKKILSPYAKNIFHLLFKNIIVTNANYIGVFSEYEKNEILSINKQIKGVFIDYKWGIDSIDNYVNDQNFYENNFSESKNLYKYVFWGRLDYKYKGIDLIIKAIDLLNQKNNDIPFCVFLMGPDYNDSTKIIEREISQRKIEKYIKICTPEQYKSENKIPLREADLSIYLSRWDGFPRTLRESINFGVPILVTKETHFGDIIKKNENGILIEDFDNIEKIADAMLHFCDRRNIEISKINAFKIRESLTWDSVVNLFVDQIN